MASSTLSNDHQYLLTQDRLKELLHYNPDSGLFTRLKTTNNRAKAGSEPGWKHCKGYRAIRIDGKDYLSHRLAWFYMTGEWPEEIDHKNMNRIDNKWDNLRNVTHQQNMQNVAKERDCKILTKLNGACWDKSTGSWKSSICINGKQKHLGRFDTDLEAHEAYILAKRVFHSGNLL